MMRLLTSLLLTLQLALAPMAQPHAPARAGVEAGSFGIEFGQGATTGLLRRGGQLTLASLGERALDATLSSGLDAAVHRSKFRQGVLTAMASHVVHAAGGDAIGEWADLHGHYGLSLEKTLGKAMIGCLVSEAVDANCAAGAVGTLVTDALIHHSGATGNFLGADTPEQYRDRLEIIAAISGYFASGGEAGNVHATVSAALSDYDNNCGPCVFLIPVVVGLLTAADYALTANDAYQLTSAGLACDGGDQAACDRAFDMAETFAIETGISLSVGQFVPGDKVGMAIVRWMRRSADDDAINAVNKAINEIEAPNNVVRSADELLTNGRVPSVRDGEFNRWFDDLSPTELDNLWADDAVRRQIERRIRQPGGLHEWCMACRAPEFRRWGVSMDEIQRFRVRIHNQ